MQSNVEKFATRAADGPALMPAGHLAPGLQSVWSVHIVSISRHQYFIRPLAATLNLHACQSRPTWHAETTRSWSSIDKRAQELTSRLRCLPIRNVCAPLTVRPPLICGEGKPFGCVSESLRGLQGLVGR